ncbi:hypothetical protein RRG08_022852 [Elysia crispata]|uniref:Uncharacterized protein n=1 Tax=Elysia crispata TaxID=231223 RepID=A0AAE0Z0G4_9GAST|nr:hypothetical protein RRG08_022852 [Elysia crispata]
MRLDLTDPSTSEYDENLEWKERERHRFKYLDVESDLARSTQHQSIARFSEEARLSVINVSVKRASCFLLAEVNCPPQCKNLAPGTTQNLVKARNTWVEIQ